MKINTGDFVMPGDFLSVSEQFLPGDGAYEDDGSVKSATAGNVSIDKKAKEISVISKSNGPNLLKVGDIVYGEIKDLRGQRALVTVHAKKGETRELALPYLAAIHISQITPGYIDKITDAFRIGDLIEARVVKIMKDNIDLNTEDRDCGVVKAMCTKCRAEMNPVNQDEVYCPVCDRKEKRKVSSNYEE